MWALIPNPLASFQLDSRTEYVKQVAGNSI